MSYGTVYTGQIESAARETVTVALEKEGYTGSASEMRLGADPLSKEGGRGSSEDLAPTRPHVLTIGLHPSQTDVLDDIYAGDAEWRARVTVDGALDFLGPIRKELLEQSDDKFLTDTLSLTANCGLGLLDRIDFEASTGSPYSGRRPVIEWVLRILRKLPVSLDVVVSSEWYTPSMRGDVCPLEQEYVGASAFYDDGEPESCLSALESLLGDRLAFITQVGGVWRISQRAQYRADTFTEWTYPADWTDEDPPALSSTYSAATTADPDEYRNRHSDSTWAQRTAYPRVQMAYQHGAAPNIVPPFFRSIDGVKTNEGKESLQTYYELSSQQSPKFGNELGFVQTNTFLFEDFSAEMSVARSYGDYTLNETVGGAYVQMQSGREVLAGQELYLSVDHAVRHFFTTELGEAPFEWLGVLQVALQKEDGTTRYLKRGVDPSYDSPVKYQYNDPVWTSDKSYVLVRFPAKGDGDVQTDELVAPPTPFDGRVELAVHSAINLQDESEDQVQETEYSTWAVSRPTLRPQAVSGGGAEATVARARSGSGEQWSRDTTTGTGPSQVHDGATEVESYDLAQDWKVGPYSGGDPSGDSLAVVAAREALRQLHKRRRVLRWPVRKAEVDADLTTVIVTPDGRRYLPYSTTYSYKEARIDIEASLVRRPTSLSTSLFERRGGSGGSGGSGGTGGGAGGGAGGWGQLTGIPGGIFSRSGERGTVQPQKDDITGALGYTPADSAPGTGLAPEGAHQLGIADDGVGTAQLGTDAVTADTIAPLAGDVAFDDGVGEGAVLRGARDALEVRKQSDPSSYGTLTAAEVELVDGGSGSRYTSEIVEIADSLLELNTDADADVWGGHHVYRGRKSDGSGTGLPAKGAVWSPSAGRWGSADVDAAGDNGVVTDTFSPFLQPDREETIDERWAFQLKQELQSGWESDGFTAGLLTGSGVSAYTDADGRTVMEADILRGRDYIEALEFIVQKVRATGGSIVVSAGTMKVSGVSGSGPYFLSSEDDHSLQVGDAIEARQSGQQAHLSQLRVTSVIDSTTVKASLPDGLAPGASDAPEAGMEYVVLGNDQDVDRQNVIYITATDSPAPRIDQYEDSTGWDLGQATRTGRFGVGPGGDMRVEAARGLFGSLDKTGQYLEYGDGVMTLAGTFHQEGGSAPTGAGLWGTDGHLGYFDGDEWTSVLNEDGSGAFAGGAIAWDAQGRASLTESVAVGGRGLSTEAFQRAPVALWHWDQSHRGVHGTAPTDAPTSVPASGVVDSGSLVATIREGRFSEAISVEPAVSETFSDGSDLGQWAIETSRTLLSETRYGEDVYRLSGDGDARNGLTSSISDGVVGDATYTFSVWMRAAGSTSYRLHIAGRSAYGSIPDDGRWHRVTEILTVPSSPPNSNAEVNVDGTNSIDVVAPQVERKGYATRFAPGTRSSGCWEASLGSGGLKQWSVSFWYRLRGHDGSDRDALRLYNGDGDYLRFRIGDPTNDEIGLAYKVDGSVGSLTSGLTAQSGTWHHVVVSYDAGSIAIHVDGSQAASVSQSGVRLSELQMSKYGAKDFDDLAVWEHTLSTEEVRRLYESKAPLRESPQTAASIAQGLAESYTDGQVASLGDVADLDELTSTYIEDGAVVTRTLAADAVVANKIDVAVLGDISGDLGTVVKGRLESQDGQTVLDFSTGEMSLHDATLTGSLTTGQGALGGWSVGVDSLKSSPVNGINALTLLGNDGKIQIKDPDAPDEVLKIGAIDFAASEPETISYFQPSRSASCSSQTARSKGNYAESCDDPSDGGYDIQYEVITGGPSDYRLHYTISEETNTDPADDGTAYASADGYVKIQARDSSGSVLASKSAESGSGQMTITAPSGTTELRVEVGAQASSTASVPSGDSAGEDSSASASAEASAGSLEKLGAVNEFISSKGAIWNPGRAQPKRAGVKRNTPSALEGAALMAGDYLIGQDGNGNLVKHNVESGSTSQI